MDTETISRITLEIDGTKAIIELNKNELSIGDTIEDLVIPALIAVGYSSRGVEKYFNNEG